MLVCVGDAEFAPSISERDDVSTGKETDGELRVRRAVTTRHMVSLAGGFSIMPPKLSTVRVEFGS